MGVFSLFSIHPSKPPPLVAVNGPKAQILVPSGSQFAFFPPSRRGHPQNERGYGPYPSHHRRPREPSPGYSEASDFPPAFERQGRGRRGAGLRGGAARPYTPPSEDDMDGMNGMGMEGMSGRGRPGGLGGGMGGARLGAVGGMPVGSGMGMDGMARPTSAPAAYGAYPGMPAMGAIGGMGGMYPAPMANVGGMPPGMGNMGPGMGGGGIPMNPGMPPAYGAGPVPGLGGVGGNPYAQYPQPAGGVMPGQPQLHPQATTQPTKRRVAHIPGGIPVGTSGKPSRSKTAPNGHGGCKCGSDSDAPKLDSLDACVCSKKCSCKGGIRTHYFDQGENGESIKGQIRYVLSENMGRNCDDHANCYSADGKRKGKWGSDEQFEASRNETKGGFKMLKKELAEMNERLGQMAMSGSSSPGQQAAGPYPATKGSPQGDPRLGGMLQDPMMGRPQLSPPGMQRGGGQIMPDPRMAAMGYSYPSPSQNYGAMDMGMNPYDSYNMKSPMMIGRQGMPSGMMMSGQRRRGGRPLPGMMSFGRPPPMGMGMRPRGEQPPRRGLGRRRRPEFADDDMDMRRGEFGDMGIDEDDDWEDLGDDLDDFDDEDRPPGRHSSQGVARRGGRPGGQIGRGRQAHVEDEDEE